MRPVDKESITRFMDIAGSASRIVVVGHEHPDGDAIGGAIGLVSWLEGKGKDARAVLPDCIPGNLAFMSHPRPESAPAVPIITADLQQDAADEAFAAADLLICEDFNAFPRAGRLAEKLESFTGKKILIDHHIGPDYAKFDLVFSDTSASSTCEFVYWILLGAEGSGEDAGTLPEMCRFALMTGMTTDTNGFANSTSPTTLRMAAGLIATGIDRDEIMDLVFHNYPERRFRLLGMVLSSSLKISDNGVAVMVLGKKTMQAYGIQEGDTEGFANIPLQIGKVRISIMLKEDEGHYRVSIRSRRGITINTLAAEAFHGGGHAQASGGRLYFADCGKGIDIADKSDAVEYAFNAARNY